jgi:hypothetical protein
MKKSNCCWWVVTLFLLVGLNVNLASAVSLPEIPKLPIPSVPSVPSPPAAATTAIPATVDQRIEAQEKKIELGLKSKVLTQAEGTTLSNNLKFVKQQEKRLKEDGKLTPEETQWLIKLLDYNNRMIDDRKNHPIDEIRDVYHRARIEFLQDKINQGIASGDLDKKEAKEVQDDLNKTKAELARFEKDGKLSADEREKLNEMLAHNNRYISARLRPPAKK